MTKTRRAKRNATVKLCTLEPGMSFRLPDSGRVGRVLSAPTVSSVYCRLFRLPDEERTKKYDDVPLAGGTEVLVLKDAPQPTPET